ncbi:MAG: glycosyltransferase family 61 protein [Verrucomicrobiota bacterium]
MPDVSIYYDLVWKLRRYPLLHRPLKNIRRLFQKTIPAKAVEILAVFAPSTAFRFGRPKKSFSIYNSVLLEKRRPRQVVLTDQGQPETTENSLQVICGLSQHASQPWPIFWSDHKNARLVSSSLALLDEKKNICRESVYGDVWMNDDPALNYVWLPKPTFLSGNWTSVVARWVPNDGVPTFSHWIMDALPRLALLSEFPSDTKILIPCRLAGYQRETLSLLGLLERCRYTPEKHLLVENYYFSPPTAQIACYNPYAVNYLRSVFLPRADQSYQGPKRFIIARRGKTRGIQNETEVNEFFQKLGWAIVDTEKLTFAQEIQLFSNAEAFAGILGSGFTNAIWSKPGCKVITFVASNWLDGWVEWICQVNKLDYHWKIFPGDHAMTATVDLGEIKKMLRTAGLDAG